MHSPCLCRTEGVLVCSGDGDGLHSEQRRMHAQGRLTRARGSYQVHLPHVEFLLWPRHGRLTDLTSTVNGYETGLFFRFFLIKLGSYSVTKVTKISKLGSISDMLRATYHADVTVCNRDRESGLPKCLPLPGDPRSNFHRLILLSGHSNLNPLAVWIPVIFATRTSRTRGSGRARFADVHGRPVRYRQYYTRLRGLALPPRVHANVQTCTCARF
jgi:hypothetical protein